MWKDHDARPFAATPNEYYSSLLWDGADQMAFRPLARFWAVDPGGESVNVNSWDEVPSSSWFQNRIGLPPGFLGTDAMTPAELATGPCSTPPLDPHKTWTAVGAKPNGDNPGFQIEGPDGHRYLLKFDGKTQYVRATTADVVVSKLYHAAGYNVPCNRVVFFDRDIIEIAPDAESENAEGDKVAMTEEDLDKVFEKALQLPDGRYRGSSSLYLDGEPLGPFRYEGIRDDDPNDVVPHQDRRELRASQVIAAWTGHTDSREQNTLDMFIETPRGGFVRHHLIDFGDCLGSVWEPPLLGRRLQHSAYFDAPEIFADWLSLGLIVRPWDDLRFGPSGKVFGYYDVEHFYPDDWEPGYPNPAMSRMTERDGAWMARILARISDAHLVAAIGEAKIPEKELRDELFRLLKRRKQKLLGRFLTRVSSLAWPVTDGRELCVEDMVITAGAMAASARRYHARGWSSLELERVEMPRPQPRGEAQVCVTIPRQLAATAPQPRYFIADLQAWGGSAERWPLRVHLYDRGDELRIVGLQRPESAEPPEG